MSAFLPGWLSLTDILFFVVLFIVFIFFLRDFKLTSLRSWVLLIGLIGLGGVLVLQIKKRRDLLAEFEEREKKLKALEDRYNELLQNSKITEEAYKKAKKELEEAKVQAGLAIMKADKKLDDTRKNIEDDFKNVSPDETVANIKAALGRT